MQEDKGHVLTNVSDARVEFALGRVLRKFPGYYVASTESQLSIGPPAFVDYGRPELTL